MLNCILITMPCMCYIHACRNLHVDRFAFMQSNYVFSFCHEDSHTFGLLVERVLRKLL